MPVICCTVNAAKDVVEIAAIYAVVRLLIALTVKPVICPLVRLPICPLVSASVCVEVRTFNWPAFKAVS